MLCLSGINVNSSIDLLHGFLGGLTLLRKINERSVPSFFASSREETGEKRESSLTFEPISLS